MGMTGKANSSQNRLASLIWAYWPLRDWSDAVAISHAIIAAGWQESDPAHLVEQNITTKTLHCCRRGHLTEYSINAAPYEMGLCSICKELERARQMGLWYEGCGKAQANSTNKLARIRAILEE